MEEITITRPADHLAILEDALVDLGALLRILLYVSEVSPKGEFADLKGELNTFFYIMSEKVRSCANASEDVARALRVPHICECGRTHG